MSNVVWKFLAGAIGLFWLGMTGQLARNLISPEDAHMAEVPPEYVAGLFLGRADPSQLVLMKGSLRAGEVSIGTRRIEAEPGSGGVALTQLSLAGWIQVEHPLLQSGRVSGRVTLDLDDAFSLRRAALTLRIPNSRGGFEMEFDPVLKDLRYRSKEDGVEAGAFEEGDFNQMKMLLAMNGLNIDEFGLENGEEPSSTALLERSGAKLSARRGQMTIRGERFHGYLLKIDFGDGELKLIVSEAGELMQVQTFLDYELLSEVFVPLEAEPDEKQNE